MGLFSRDNKNDEQKLSMVKNQLIARGIKNQKVLDAMQEIPRHLFVPSKYQKDAYNDGPLPISEGQTISQPYMVALMTECLGVKDNDKVLEIGTGSGYQMAILLKITSRVYSIERFPSLTECAISTLKSLGFEYINIKTADGTLGWPEEAPFDGIIVTSAAPRVPEQLKSQLADGGRLVIPVGSRHTQQLYILTRNGKHFTTEENTACVFVPLVGKYGWDD
jgi:protein-L-isoaspartate(D-aspartate) O-methyltransferase